MEIQIEELEQRISSVLPVPQEPLEQLSPILWL